MARRKTARPGRLRQVLFYIRTFISGVLYLVLTYVLLSFLFRSLGHFPSSHEERREQVLRKLVFLRHAIREGEALERMQKMFPEGACFTCTLYGLTWANLIRELPGDAGVRKDGLREIAYILEQYEKPVVSSIFLDTQVRRGVFWLGQRNMVLGRYLSLLPEEERPERLVEEFHNSSEQLAEAFLASPTRHLDSYIGMCWPSDNVTALVSLLVHDDLYGTSYREAYKAWKTWTLEHPDPETGMPAGHLARRSGILLEPARGCANSWNLGLLPEVDPEFSREQYKLYKKHFCIRRLGFRMFREYPEGRGRKADVDSGPIIWDAGCVATGIGLGAARANGDMETAVDIHDLANMWGWPRKKRYAGEEGEAYLFGLLPVGDAFLAWGSSVPIAEADRSASISIWNRFRERYLFYSAFLLVLLLWFLRGFLLVRGVQKRWVRQWGSKGAKKEST